MSAGRASSAGAAGERGSIALVVAILAAAMLMMAGLVIDGGAAIAAREKAAAVAEQAARAGADALSPASLRDDAPGALVADPRAAAAAANRVLAAEGATGTVEVGAEVVSVTARVARHTAVLSAVGLNDISQSATWSARVLHGTTTEGS